MTAVEKANHLYHSMSYWHMVDGGVNKDMAKQCALIAVDEILNNDGFTRFDQYLTEYWKEVKQEINNL